MIERNRHQAAQEDAAYASLLHSDRVSKHTREILLDRATPSVADAVALSEAERATLVALVACIVPQASVAAAGIAARIETAIASGAGDGWRFAGLPPDRDAYRTGIRTLDAASGGSGFVGLDEAGRHAILQRAAAGELESDAGFDGQQSKRWFEDVRADAVKAYAAHPATMARIGYGGIAYGGDGERLQGFHALEPGAREDWEPRASVGEAP